LSLRLALARFQETDKSTFFNDNFVLYRTGKGIALAHGNWEFKRFRGIIPAFWAAIGTALGGLLWIPPLAIVSDQVEDFFVAPLLGQYSIVLRYLSLILWVLFGRLPN